MTLTRLILPLVLPPLLVVPLRAQDQTATPGGNPPIQQSVADQKKHDKKTNDRLFYALPNFMTLENAASAPPLSAGQKFALTARGTFDPVEFVWYGAQAGISQWKGSDPTYGQGMEGFGKRFGEVFADGTIENFFSKAIFPTILREDPRYFQMGHGGVWRRMSYAVSRIIVTRKDSGGNQVNFSEFLGAGSAAAISAYSYHPADDRNLSGVATTAGTQILFDALSNVVKEFWPDLRRKLSKSKSDTPPPQPGSH